MKDISFQVEKGEILALLGPNGAGKTTTLKMLSGILFPTAGQVFHGSFQSIRLLIILELLFQAFHCDDAHSFLHFKALLR